jgi:hypothetical protein
LKRWASVAPFVHGQAARRQYERLREPFTIRLTLAPLSAGQLRGPSLPFSRVSGLYEMRVRLERLFHEEPFAKLKRDMGAVQP